MQQPSINPNTPKFFGRRKGRTIRCAKSALLADFLPSLRISNTTEISTQMFGCPVEKIYLEIGFGNGEHLAEQARRNPKIGFIGAEVFQNGVANLLSLITGIKIKDELPETIKLSDGRVDNIRIFDDDMRLLFQRIPDNSLDKVFLLFPDPWPKKRHAGRRFVNPENLRELSRCLKKGGILRIATDHKVYKHWTLHQLHDCPFFAWTATCGNDWKHEPIDWVQTKYQRKALREGRRAVFLDYKNIK